MPANLTDLTLTLCLCEANSTAASIVRDLCNNGGYLLASHTETSAWLRLSMAPHFRDLRFCVKDVAGNREVVSPASVRHEVSIRRKFADLPITDPNCYRSVREVFILADDLDILRKAAEMIGWLSGFNAPSNTVTFVPSGYRIVCNNTL